jgi:hypothetical protein
MEKRKMPNAQEIEIISIFIIISMNRQWEVNRKDSKKTSLLPLATGDIGFS